MIERRFTAGISLRMSEGPSPKISGYCARFEPVISSDLGGFREKIRKGAFYNSLQSDRDVICNVEHDNARILGRKKNGTLALSEDNYGLRFACALPDTTDGRDVAALIKRSDLSEMSFAFQVDPDGDEWDEDGEDPDERGKRCLMRTLKSVRILDCSIVANPAYPRTGVHLSADPMTMDPTAFAPRNLFPDGVPAEVRARVPHIGTSQERRRRLTSYLL